MSLGGTTGRFYHAGPGLILVALISAAVVHGMVAAIMLHAGQLWLGRTSE